MATEQSQNPAPVTTTAEPKVELATNAKSKDMDASAKDPECTCPVHPSLPREDTIESRMTDMEEDYLPRSRPRRRGPARRYSPSPIRYRSPRAPLETAMVASSTALLEKVGSYDGIADMPHPSRSSIYLTTFPFTDRDVKKYAWLFVHGIENTTFSEPSGNPDYEDLTRYPAVIRERRSHSPYYEPRYPEVSSVFLSKALDEGVVKDTEEGVRFWIVVQNRQGTRLLVAESRKAAGIMCYYEALSGNSIMFVGATVHQGKNVRGMKLKRVENLEEARALQDENEGIVGVVC